MFLLPTLGTLGRMFLHLSPLVSLPVSLLGYFRPDYFGCTWPDAYTLPLPLVSAYSGYTWPDLLHLPPLVSLLVSLPRYSWLTRVTLVSTCLPLVSAYYLAGCSYTCLHVMILHLSPCFLSPTCLGLLPIHLAG